MQSPPPTPTDSRIHPTSGSLPMETSVSDLLIPLQLPCKALVQVSRRPLNASQLLMHPITRSGCSPSHRSAYRRRDAHRDIHVGLRCVHQAADPAVDQFRWKYVVLRPCPCLLDRVFSLSTDVPTAIPTTYLFYNPQNSPHFALTGSRSTYKNANFYAQEVVSILMSIS